MKATAQYVAGSFAIVCALGHGVAWGSALTPSGQYLLAAALYAQNEASDQDTAARRQVDDLLLQARKAMEQGDAARADALITQAESRPVRFGLFHLGDTPQKARRDLQKLSGPGQPVPAPGQSLNPFGSTNQSQPATVDPFLSRGENPSATASGGEPAPIRPPVVSIGGSGDDPRASSDAGLLAARRALAVGDTRRATEALEKSRGLRVDYGFHEDSPDRVEAAIRKYQDVVDRRAGRQDTEAWRRQYAEVLMEQADALLRWNEFDEAERITSDAQRLGVAYGPFEASPQTLLERIAAQRKIGATATRPVRTLPVQPAPANQPAPSSERKAQVLSLLEQGRSALYQGQLDQAQRIAGQALALNVPDTAYRPDEDRPWLLALDIEKARRGQLPVGPVRPPMQPGQVEQSGYDPARDGTREKLATGNAPANELLEFAPEELPVGRSNQYELQEPAAAADLNRPSGQPSFEQPQPQQPLPREPIPQQENVPQPIGRQQDNPRPIGQEKPMNQEGQSLIADAAAKQQVLARQLSADVAKAHAESRKIREKDPKRAATMLREIREKVAASSVDAAAQAQLLRRVDLAITEVERFIDENRAQIELDEQNQAVQSEVDRRRWARVGVQQKLADMVEEFNKLIDEQRYAEAEVVAKRAREMFPDEPIVGQMGHMARYIRRNNNQKNFLEEKEEAVYGVLDSVEKSARPFDDREPYRFDRDAHEWEKLTLDRRERLKRDGRGRRTERELEIEQKLKTPVSLKFQGRPLAEVMNQLARLTGVNIHLDARGLAEEGVTSDMPVTIMLDSDISLKSALNLILDELHLSYVIKDEVLKITSEQLRDGQVHTVTYNVADLVIPIPNFVPGSHLGLQGQIQEAYGAMGMGGAGGPAAPPLAVLAGQNGGGGAGMINPQVMAQMQSGMGSRPHVGQPSGHGPGGLGGGVEPDFDSLIELITGTIQPNSWDAVGGPGSVRQFETNLSLVISQTQDVHEEIVDLLEQLRRLQDLQVTIEVRFIQLSDNFFEEIGIDFDFNIDDGISRTEAQLAVTDTVDPSVTVGVTPPSVPGGVPAFTADLDIPFRQESFSLAVPSFGAAQTVSTFGFAILSDIEAFFLIKASQGDQRSNVLQAPKVTLFNGQQAFVSDTSQTPFVISVIPVVGDFAAAQQPVIVVLSEGTFLTIQAVVSNDRRYVRLTVVPFFSQIGDVTEFTFEGSSTTTTGSKTGQDDDAVTTPSKETNNTQSRQGTTVQLPTFAFVTVTTTVSVPDGGTVLLGGIKRLSEARGEFGVPLLSKLPYVNRLFRNVSIGREAQSLMMMVTPRIIIQEEEEERLGVSP